VDQWYNGIYKVVNMAFGIVCSVHLSMIIYLFTLFFPWNGDSWLYHLLNWQDVL